MPRSATGSWTSSGFRRRGFTLVEILAVVAVIAAFTGLAVLSLGDGGREREIRHEAQRLAALIDLAREEALLGADEVGIAFTRHRYHFQRQMLVDEGDAVAWRDIPDDDELRPRSLREEGVELALAVEGREVPLDTDPEHPDPQVFVSGTGEVTPFELILQNSREPEHAVRLSAEMDGSLTVESADDGRLGL